MAKEMERERAPPVLAPNPRGRYVWHAHQSVDATTRESQICLKHTIRVTVSVFGCC